MVVDSPIWDRTRSACLCRRAHAGDGEVFAGLWLKRKTYGLALRFASSFPLREISSVPPERTRTVKTSPAVNFAGI
jgi:hypothetical protein